MKVVALKDLPDGTLAGRVIELDPDVVAILALPGVDAVRPATDDEAQAAMPARRGAYRTRSLRASA